MTMKSLLYAALVALPSFAFAQGPTEPTDASIMPLPPLQKHELGLIFQNGLGNSSNANLLLAGLQYNHWVNEHLGYRIIAGYGNYRNNSNSNNFSINQDTILRKQYETKVNMPVIGAGLMAQRHFYKRVYFFAGIEARGAYGKGTQDTVVRTEYTGPDNITQTSLRNGRVSTDVRMLRIDLDATLGAKLVSRKLVVGVEVLPVNIGYHHQNINADSFGIVDANLGSFSNRIFLNFRL